MKLARWDVGGFVGGAFGGGRRPGDDRAGRGWVGATLARGLSVTACVGLLACGAAEQAGTEPRALRSDSNAGAAGDGEPSSASPPPASSGTGAIAGGQDGRGSDTRPPPPAAPPTMDAECSSVSETAEFEDGPVDIVWIVDGSGSMVDETVAVQQNISAFAQQISGAGVDHHVVMIAGADLAAGTPLAMDPEHYLWVPGVVGSSDALDILLNLYPAYSAFLRPEAPLHIVVVTDDNARMPHAVFQMGMENLAGKPFIFHSIASEDAPGPCIGSCGLPVLCSAAEPGREYYALSEITQGEAISICVADWSQVFGPLQDAVIKSVPLPCTFPIPSPPNNETLDPSKVNVEFSPTEGAAEVFPRAAAEADCGDTLAWFYDDPSLPTALNLCPATCEAVQAGGTVDIAFGCATIEVR